jgi:flagellar biosynthesis protein FlhF
MSAPHRSAAPAPGKYRFEVTSAEQAVTAIRSHLGTTAQVVAVNTPTTSAFKRWFSTPKIEVIAMVPPPAEPEELATEPAPEPEPANAVSALSTIADSADVATLLRRSGFPEKLIARWARNGRGDTTRPLHHVLADLAKELMPHGTTEITDLGPRVAFLGQAGVGRTTALCKWLAHETINRKRQGVVWRVEFDRPNPTPQADVFAEAIGSWVEHYAAGITELTTDFMVADLPALPAVGSPQSAACKRLLDDEKIESRVLVLNALFAPEALRSAYARGVELGATHLVVTHLDEMPRWGHLWEFLWEGDLIPVFASTGPELIGDVIFDVLDHVLQRTVPRVGREVA